jgi:hypothetical protein
LFQAAQPVIYLDSENISMRAIGRGIWIGLCGAFGFTLLPQLSQTSPPQDSIFSMLFMVSKPRTSPDEGQKACQHLAKLGLLVLSCFFLRCAAPRGFADVLLGLYCLVDAGTKLLIGKK